jgi:hypothetical protein
MDKVEIFGLLAAEAAALTATSWGLMRAMPMRTSLADVSEDTMSPIEQVRPASDGIPGR